MSTTPPPPPPPPPGPPPPELLEPSHPPSAATALAVLLGNAESPAVAPAKTERSVRQDQVAAGPGEARWAKELLAALQANHQEMEGQAFGYPLVRQGSALKTKTAALIGQVDSLTARELSAIACHFSLLLFQLRAWYTEDCGMALIALLGHIAAQTSRLPSRDADPGMGVLRLLEGVVLLCTALHQPVAVARCIHRLLKNRRLPPGVSARLDAAVVCLDTQTYPGVPHKENLSVTQEIAEGCLVDMADSLAPPPEVVENVDRAKSAIKQAVISVFPGTTRLELFGSSVNGFETKTSDIDCVVILDLGVRATLLAESEAASGGASEFDQAADSEWRQERAIAAQGALMLKNAVTTNPEVAKLGLRVVELVDSARVPILKLSSAEDVAIDVSFNNTLPLHNSKLLRSYAKFDKRVQRLGRLVKHWAKQRNVNDSYDGTLSSYAHILLVIHYLQHVGVVPNLQDRGLLAVEKHAEVGETSRVDEIHDVWFMDPESPASHEAVQRWSDGKSDDATDSTLFGLLHGFFRYFAYEFAMHSTVVSIRHGIGTASNAVNKLGYFRMMVEQREKMRSSDGAAVAAAASVESSPLVAAVGSEVQVDATPSAADGNAAREPDDTAAGELDQVRLPKDEYAFQQQVAKRQLFCIDDPMEFGRHLGTTFQGGERLVHEFRRALNLLSDTPDSRKVSEVFSNKPPPPASVWKLPELPSVYAKRSTVQKIEEKFIVTPPQVIRLLRGGKESLIAELQRFSGIDRIHIEGRETHAPEVQVTGVKHAVLLCIKQCKARLAEAADNSQSQGYGRGRGTTRSDDRSYDRSYGGKSSGGKGAAGGGKAFGLWSDPTKGKRDTATPPPYGREEPSSAAPASYYGNGTGRPASGWEGHDWSGWNDDDRVNSSSRTWRPGATNGHAGAGKSSGKGVVQRPATASDANSSSRGGGPGASAASQSWYADDGWSQHDSRAAAAAATASAEPVKKKSSTNKITKPVMNGSGFSAAAATTAVRTAQAGHAALTAWQ